MTKMILGIAALIAATLTTQASGNANTRVATVIAAEAGVPAIITRCIVTSSSVQWTLLVDFTDKQPSTLTAVKLRFEEQDAFGSTLQTNDISHTGTFSQGVSTSAQMWTVGALNMPSSANVAKVRCSIVQTLAEDGSTWKAPTADTPVNPAKR